VELRFPGPEEMPLVRFRRRFEFADYEVRQDTVDRHTRLLRVEEKLVANDAVRPAADGIIDSHSRVPEQEYECLQALRVGPASSLGVLIERGESLDHLRLREWHRRAILYLRCFHVSRGV
jgi:hypothetical protein